MLGLPPMNTRKELGAELDALRERLGAAQGKRYWRCLEELADDPALQELMAREFPEQASVWPASLSRRQFLTVMGASLALAGLSGCSVQPAPAVNIVPYVRAPEEIVPGKPLFYATAMTHGGAGVGLLVESHLGRPTKIEGNPQHPASLGAADLFHQASVLGLYDPDRSQTVTLLGKTTTWDAALGERDVGRIPSLGGAMRRLRKRGGEGLHILTETVVSPTLARQLADLRSDTNLPRTKWYQYEPVHRDAARRGAQLAFGRHVNTRYSFHNLKTNERQANVVLSLDADFLTCGPGHLRHVAEFMAGRRVRTGPGDARKAQMNRLYVVETMVSSTGAKADHRLALRPHQVELFARAVTRRVADNLAGQGSGDFQGALRPMGAATEAERALAKELGRWIEAVANDLTKKDNLGHSIVLAGDRQPPAVHLLAHALNRHLRNVDKTVFYTDALEYSDKVGSLKDLAEDMDRGRVELLVILGGNPVYTAPADVDFATRLAQFSRLGKDGKPEDGRLSVHLSLYQDETSRLCHWHLPEAHYLEAWSDTRADDGTVSIVQPLIQPLYHGQSVHEVLSALVNQLKVPGEQLVRATWRKHWESHGRSGRFNDFWQSAVHDGVVPDTALPQRSLKLGEDWARHVGQPAEVAAKGYEVSFQPDPTIYDGRFANNGWLQELPKPITTLTWDNAVLMSPKTARDLGLDLGKYAHGGEHGGYEVPVVELRLGRRSVRGPIWIVPGHADGCVTLTLGYGREVAGKVGGSRDQRVGFNAYRLRNSDHPWSAGGLTIESTGCSHVLACTQQHHAMEGREPVRSATLDKYKDKPHFARLPEEAEEKAQTQRGARKPLTLYKPYEYKEHKWGMVIDLTTCTGCKACVVACQAENNIPVVGKEQVSFGREMHWLRIDRYFKSEKEKPEVPTEYYFQPVPCMHCENAPCEYVCPVEATVHSADGLNDMIYQRCVGTRFCSNNCPYKVRRFNFFFYADYATESLRQQFNPDVTVRSRGVMEKCSYCVQRIRHAQISAEVASRPIADGDVLTACQAACPAQAIVFGDINDTKSTVKKWKDSPLHYALLGDLNTEPRTTYLAALRNPNPALKGT
jgi:molybdopterin-containing oxidoreductase family iron-sulfur binding subunit